MSPSKPGRCYRRAAAALALVFCFALPAQAENPDVPVSGSLSSDFGCQLDYEVYRPPDGQPAASVVLAHGFMRSLKTTRGWGEYWLAHNIATVVVSFCNSTFLNGHHERNAADMVALRKHLKLEGVVYAGFSAGGLAAYLAALQDDSTSGYLGLDSVDSGRLAKNSDSALEVPSLFLFADPSACNAGNNMAETITRHGYPSTHIEGATHCHFESPYAPRCSWICGRSTPEQTAAIQAEIMRRATEWILVSAESPAKIM